MADTLVIWAVVSRSRDGGPWRLVVDDLGAGPDVMTFSHKALAERYVDSLADSLRAVGLYMPLPMQGHPLLAEATRDGRSPE